MSDGSQLARTIEIPGVVTVTHGNGGLTKIIVTPDAQGPGSYPVAEIYTNGATVTRYDVAGRRLLFCSRTSRFEAGKAIRGGVPVIFPWFGPHSANPSLPQHGFVRASEWRVASTRWRAHGEASIVFAFESSDETRAMWPFDFELRYTVSVGARLTMTLEVTNRSESEFRFEEALHTYLSVSDIRRVHISGLENTEYLDKVDGMSRHQLGMQPLRFTGETDRVFLNTDADCRVHDPERADILVRKEGSLSTVIWNPWQAKAESLPDLGGDQWPGMVCVETANVEENVVALAPGASHIMRAVIEP